jgi:predicted phage terminase large subunit-like protein
MSLSQQTAAKELLYRREVRRDMNAWARHCGFEPALHHKVITAVIMRAIKREVRKVAIFMPPGSAKSSYASILSEPFYLANCPQDVILLCSHSKDLAQKFGRDCRNLIDTHENILGYSLSKDSQAADEWATSKGGGFFCAGVGGRISGRRADLAIIDDPIGSREDAESQTIRDSHWAWYLNDFKPRLKPNAVVFLIQTRFHEDDLAGRILAKEKGWEVISIPMEAGDGDVLGRQRGERLWPEWFTEEMVEDAKSDNRVWSSLYQQNPTPETGVFFEADAIRDCEVHDRDTYPKDLSMYVGSDHAVSEKQDADFTVILPCGMDGKRTLWVMPDIFWKKVNTKQVVDEMINVARRREPHMWFAENAHIEKAIGPFLEDRKREEMVFFAMQSLQSAKSKRAKAQALQGMISSRRVRFPAFASWWPKMRDELLKFDNGTHDDTVDALANVCRGLQTLRAVSIATSGVADIKPFTVAWLKAHERQKKQEQLIAENN